MTEFAASLFSDGASRQGERGAGAIRAWQRSGAAILVGVAASCAGPANGPANLPGISHGCEATGAVMKAAAGMSMPDTPDRISFCVPILQGNF